MWNEHAKGASTMLRWLRAKKMDVNGAEKMIRDVSTPFSMDTFFCKLQFVLLNFTAHRVEEKV